MFENGFEKAWNGEAYRRNRSSVAARDVAALTGICKSCKVYKADESSYPIYRDSGDSCPSTRALEDPEAETA